MEISISPKAIPFQEQFLTIYTVVFPQGPVTSYWWVLGWETSRRPFLGVQGSIVKQSFVYELQVKMLLCTSLK